MSEHTAEIVALRVINRATGEVDATLPIRAGERDMPGYVEHIESGYEGTQWRTERVTSPAKTEAS
jgi:hypothetical protein